MSVFTMDMNNVEVNEEYLKTCRSHPGCKDCPLLTGNMKIKGVEIYCNTGREKGANYG